MDKPYRLQILEALTEHLRGITVNNGYGHDIAHRIYRGRDRFGASDQVPMVSILEAKATDYGVFADDNNSVALNNWILLIQGWVVDDIVNPTDPAYYLAADVTKRLSDIVAKKPNGAPKFSGVYLLGGLISSLTIAAPVVRPPEDQLSTKAFFYLPIQVGLKTDLTNP